MLKTLKKIGILEVTPLGSLKTLQDRFGQILSISTEELVVLAEGEIEGKSQKPPIGEEVFIPANAIHTVRNVSKINNLWYYGYKNKNVCLFYFLYY